MALTSHVSRRERRTLGFAIGVVAVALLLTKGLPAYRGWLLGARTSAGEARSELQLGRTRLLREPATASVLAVRRSEFLGLGPRLLSGSTPEAAGATLAGLVSAAVSRPDVQLGSLQVLADSAGAGVFGRVRVRAAVAGDLAGVVGLLASLEGGELVLRIRELSIDQPEPGGPSEQAEVLHAEFVVEGLYLKGDWSRAR